MDFFTGSTVLSLFLGVGLAAASGFRVFLPLFFLSLTANIAGNYIEINENLLWVGSWPALITLGVAMVVEIGAYYIPFVDNMLDTISVPLAAIAGTFAVSATLVDMNEVATWALAIITGGGTAAAISSTTATARAVSTTTTGGLGNFLVNTGETVGALFLSITAIVIAPLAFIFAVILLFVVIKVWKRVKKRTSEIINHSTSNAE
ncbi:DUF4126 domain-containing protein [Faecalibacter rhinopitheci]|uniref:DUF4126 domain-containing protein n=1 Tax=Faecalibacter rhinopitheci TaxID=2779678 RepID=A0A8J7FLG3_9FLAO|nr:DUF4126 domain-containing protein [Faecalibacter rhinopitheci]MBF0596220.1 DUF4126 domain-containing protein [Faecalibacter rhinopitheci]